MSPLNIELAMSKTVETFPPDEKVRRVVETMLKKNIGAVVIVLEEKPVGIFSERDLMRNLMQGVENILDQPISAVMTTALCTIDKDGGFARAMDLMDSRNIRHLPVVENDRLVGILSIKDMLRAQLNFIRERTKPPEVSAGAA